jgi:hypothetical protein
MIGLHSVCFGKECVQEKAMILFTHGHQANYLERPIR